MRKNNCGTIYFLNSVDKATDLCYNCINKREHKEVNKMTLFIIVAIVGGMIFYNLDKNDEWNHR